MDPYIKVLVKYYQGCVIFVGINPSPFSGEWINKLKETGLDVRCKITDEKIITKQHTSAVQTALQLYKETDEKFDLVHFIHTKGISYKNQVVENPAFNDYYVGYAKKIGEIREFMGEHPKYGGWADFGMLQPQWFKGKFYDEEAPKTNEWMAQTYENSTDEIHEYWDWSRFYPFKYTPIRTQWLTGFYTMRDFILREFIDNCTDDFLNENVHNMGFDVYFFETQIAQVVCRQGYLRYTDTLWDHHEHSSSTNGKDEEMNYLDIWVKENNLVITKENYA
jgi:hypothetical protein